MGDVPLRRALMWRLLAMTVLVAVCASAVTAFITLRAPRQDEGRDLANDATIYDRLLGYAAANPGWAGVDALVAGLSRRMGRHITLRAEDRRVIADASSGKPLRSGKPLTSGPSIVVDPLHVQPNFAAAEQAQHGIDRRAVGPFQLTAAERGYLQPFVKAQQDCLRESGVEGVMLPNPNGRSTFLPLGSAAAQKERIDSCRPPEVVDTFPSEDAALRQLNDLVMGCLGGRRDAFVLDSPTTINPGDLPDDVTTAQADVCLQTARRTQLKPFVAPPAVLFVGGPDPGPSVLGFATLSSSVLLVAALLIVPIVFTLLLGRRLSRFLRPPTAVTQESVVTTSPRVPIIDAADIGILANSLHTHAEHRTRLERQRKAMVSDIVHEIRTPLGNIRSWLEAAQDGVTSTDQQFLDLLLEEAVILQRITDDLRDLAAADAGNLRINPERVYVNDLLTQVVEAHRSAADNTRVTLTVESSIDPEWHVDPTRLRQLAGNLVSNAVRHTPPGGSVVVRTSMRGDDLVLEVADTGVGISADDLPRLFDRFWRADESHVKWAGGSGLGLAIARRLAEAHGGDIAVTSEVGVGTTFTVRLPPDGLSCVEPSRAAPPGRLRAIPDTAGG